MNATLPSHLRKIIACILTLSTTTITTFGEDLRIDQVSSSPSNTRLSFSWSQNPSHLYSLLVSTNLQTWEVQNEYFSGGFGSNATYVVSIASNTPGRFYRLKQEPDNIFLTVTNPPTVGPSYVLLSVPGTNGYVLRTSHLLMDQDSNGFFDTLWQEEIWRTPSGHYARCQSTATDTPSNRFVVSSIFAPGIESNIYSSFSSLMTNAWGSVTSAITPSYVISLAQSNLPRLVLNATNGIDYFFPESAVTNASQIDIRGSVTLIDPDPTYGPAIPTGVPHDDPLCDSWATLDPRPEQFVVTYQKPHCGQDSDAVTVTKYRLTWDYGGLFNKNWFKHGEKEIAAPPDSGYFVIDAPPGRIQVTVECFAKRVGYEEDVYSTKTLTAEVSPPDQDRPVIAFSPASVVASTQQGTRASTTTFEVWESSNSILDFRVSPMAGSQMRMDLSPASDISYLNEKKTISVSFLGSESLPAGTYTGQIGIFDSKANPSARYIPVTLTINPPDGLPTAGLIAHYAFDGAPNDATDHPLPLPDATPMNSPTYISGAVGSAIYLDGSSGQHVLLPYIDLASRTAFTIALWAKIDAQIADFAECLISFGDDSQGIIGMMVWGQPPASIGFTTTGVYSWTSQPLPGSCVGNWAHYALTYDNRQLLGFVNGNLISSNPNADVAQFGVKAGLATHWWGSGTATSTRLICGIDDVLIYNRALTAAEVQQLHDAAP